MSTVLTCGGVDDTTLLQGAANAGGIYILQGPLCKLIAPIVCPVIETAFVLETNIESSAADIFQDNVPHTFGLTGNGRMRFITSTHAFGRGLVIGTQSVPSSGCALDNIRITSANSAVDVVNGSGVF